MLQRDVAILVDSRWALELEVDILHAESYPQSLNSIISYAKIKQSSYPKIRASFIII